MSFRIKSFSTNSDSFKCPAVKLSKTSTSENYFSVIIGNNGTGKSRFLSNLVNAFVEVRNNKRKKSSNYSLDYQINTEVYSVERELGSGGFKWNTDSPNFPNKVIAIATSLSDKFPSDGYGRRRDFENRLNSKEDFYTYLGTRNRMAGSSNRALMDRAISTMLQNINENDNDDRYREIFSYLEYEPVIKLSYRVYVPEYLRGYLNTPKFNGKELKVLLKDWSARRGGFRSSFYEKAGYVHLDC